MAKKFTTIEELAAHAISKRASSGLFAVPRGLYVDLVLAAAKEAAKLAKAKTLPDEDREFVESVCKGAEGLKLDTPKARESDGKRAVYVKLCDVARMAAFLPSVATAPVEKPAEKPAAVAPADKQPAGK